MGRELTKETKMFEVKVEAHFSAAHHLLNYDGKCENPHGHNWKVEAYAQGEELDQSGMLIDFTILKKELNCILDILDHHDLNTLEELQGISPSSENIAKFIYIETKKKFPQITKVCVWETERARATYWE